MKLKFTFKTKLISLFIGVSVVTNLMFFIVSYKQEKDMLIDQIESTALSICTTTALSINADEINAVLDGKDNGILYKKLESQLRKYRDSNRRDDVYVKFLYTLHQSKKDKDVIIFGVDSEEDGPDKSALNEVYKQKDNPNLHPTDFNKPQVQPAFVEDQWGTWLSANAPIFDSNGNSVGVIGVDLSANDVVRALDKMTYTGVYSLIISILLSVFMSCVISSKINTPINALLQFIKTIGSGKLSERLNLKRDDEFGILSNALNEMAETIEQKRVLNDTLVRYLTSDVFEKISNGTGLPDLKGERRKITVLFSDFRGFTTLSETLKPEEVFGILNEYFDRMVEVVHHNGGIVNKFLGDGIMAIYGSVKDDLYQEENALKTAIEMAKAVEDVNVKLKDKLKGPLKIGIGVNTGMALVGNVGSEKRMEFTAIGDTVNVASRIENKTKEFDADVIVSEYTYIETKNSFKFEPLGKVPINGRKDEINLYKLVIGS